MAGTNAFGTVLALVVGATETSVAEITSIDVLDIDVDTIDVTSHSSSGGWREFVAGLKDAGELSFDLNYDPTLHAAFYATLGAEHDWKITLTDAGAATVAFSAIMNGFKAQAPYDDKLSATVTMKVTGAPTVTP